MNQHYISRMNFLVRGILLLTAYFGVAVAVIWISCYYAGCLQTMFIISLLVMTDFYRTCDGTHYSIKEKFNMYWKYRIFRIMVSTVFSVKNACTFEENPLFAQNNFLKNLLKENADTEYGKLHKFNEIRNREEFVKRHILTKFKWYEGYVDRIANGEENVLIKEKPVLLAMTSGTTSGHGSLIPLSKAHVYEFIRFLFPIFECIFSYFPKTATTRKWLRFSYMARFGYSAANIPIGPSSTARVGKGNGEFGFPMYTSSGEIFKIQHEPSALYLHLLYGLQDKEISVIMANFSSLIYHAFIFLEKSWKTLVEDIRNGTINEYLNLDPNLRKQLSSKLKPDVKRGNELETIFQEGFDDIATRLWPDLCLVATIDSGSLAMYGNLLRNKYIKSVPFYSLFYGATEAFIGINIHPVSSDYRYAMLADSAFFEFIPVDQSDEDQPGTLFMDQVRTGATYELVITCVNGLYRYRFGDVVKVTGFHNKIPLIEFMYRQGQLLNVAAEKTPEVCVFKALMQVLDAKGMNNTLIDYTCAESALVQQVDKDDNKQDTVAHYVLFLELKIDSKDKLVAECEAKFDESLSKFHPLYGSYREKSFIGHPKVYFLQEGTFTELKNYILTHSTTSANQFKLPRLLKRKDYVQFIFDRLL